MGLSGSGRGEDRRGEEGGRCSAARVEVAARVARAGATEQRVFFGLCS
jgi:hypothetical protein